MAASFDEINALAQPEFIRRFGPLFEHSPWIAERAWKRRPFRDAENLHAALVAAMDAAALAEQEGLIRAHPDLAGKLAVAGGLTEHSTAEQKSVRLDRLTPAQFERISALNTRYRGRFGFPFVICVRDHTQESIFEEFEKRVSLDRPAEIRAALHQIGRIAWHRLQALLAAG